MSDSEDYDSVCGGPIILTEEEGAKIDAVSATHSLSATSRSSPSPELPIVIDTMPPSILPAVLNGLKVSSPFKRYRPNGRLSVTDLVAPTWCEVQYEYGLQQRRSSKLENRPTKFVTRHGKEIAVQKDTAKANDVTLKRGNAVHSALEREIHPDRIRIEVQTQEELWARKFIDMLACLQSLEVNGICREFPVVGFVHDQLVAGVIDEIKKRPVHSSETSELSSSSPSSQHSPSLPPKRRRGRPRKSSVSHSSDSEASNIISHPSPPVDSLNGHQSGCRLFLSDNKTRFLPTLPSHSATLASRLQLMLYRNLLNDLISISTPFDFDNLWRVLGIDPLQTFSDSFMAQTLFLWEDKSTMSCLKDFERQWKFALTRLGLLEKRQSNDELVSPVHEQLTLVYRLRDNCGPTGMSKRKKPSRPSSFSEDEQFQKAILESIQAIKRTTADSPLEHVDAPAGQTSGDQYTDLVAARNDMESTIKPIENTDTSSVRLAETSTGSSHEMSSDPEQVDLVAGTIIGQIQFDHDKTFLDSHIANVLEWWYGKREPSGVTIEEVNRCHTCEYISGCEWREKMAMQLLTK